MTVRIGVSLACACLLLAFGAGPGYAYSCPNAQFRTGYSAYLPDCRGFELVSPSGVQPYVYSTGVRNLTGGGQNDPGLAFGVEASAAGGAIGFFTPYAPVGSGYGPYFLSVRGSAGWSTRGVVPGQSTINKPACYNAYPAAYSPDFASLVLADGFGQPSCGTDDPSLVAGEPQGFQNLFSSAGNGGPYGLIDVTPPGVAPSDAWFQAASADLRRVVFDDVAQLTANAPAVPIPVGGVPPGDDLYEWSGGAVHLVSVLPDGTPVQGTLVNADPSPDVQGGPHPGAEVFTHAVSSDGSRVFFVTNGNLYVRENPDQPQSPLDAGHCTVATDACTVQVDASQAGGAGGGGAFMWASADGSEVFFSDDAAAGLTSDTVPGSGQNLYRFDVPTGQLTDLTPAADAGVQGVSGVSDDGSYVYFVAEGVLAAGATGGQPNLYLAHGGSTTFIATLDPANDTLDWTPSYLTARVSSDGRFLAFNSLASLTGYDNLDASTGGLDQEIFLYDAADNRLRCASCDPSGAPPTAPSHIQQPAYDLIQGPSLPGYPQRFLADDGRVFFDTTDALLAGASNGQSNVYEWEPGGVGSCAQAGGCLSLISSGTSGDPSYFYDASQSGDDVYFLTTQRLVGQDTGAGVSVYDARVGGGFPEPAGSPACSGDACRGPLSSPPSMPTIASVTFYGPENIQSGAPALRLRVLTRTVHGSRVALRVSVPIAGRVTISGAGVRAVGRSLPAAGTYTLRLTLTRRTRRALRHRHKLKLRLRLAYTPVSAAPSSTTVSLTVER